MTQPTLTPKQRAELAARVCAVKVCDAFGTAHFSVGFLGATHWNDVEEMVKTSIPIEQLFAVEDAIRQIGVHGSETDYEQSCPICMSLLALDSWRKERDREEKK